MAKITWKSQVEIETERQERENKRIADEQIKADIESAPARVTALEDENMMLMMASAEMYEEMYNENMNLMLAVAEMYEMMLGGAI